MKIWDRIKQWASASDDERVAMDRRAFLRGMAVTSAGLLVPGATLFDMGSNVVRPLRFERVEFSLVPEGGHPLRTPMTVLGADDPTRKKVGFTVQEKLGVGIINPRGITEFDP